MSKNNEKKSKYRKYIYIYRVYVIHKIYIFKFLSASDI